MGANYDFWNLEILSLKLSVKSVSVGSGSLRD